MLIIMRSNKLAVKVFFLWILLTVILVYKFKEPNSNILKCDKCPGGKIIDRTIANATVPKKLKYFLSAVLLVRIYEYDKAKWSREDLRQWIRYVQYAGVEHVYLYDNYKHKSESLEVWCRTFFKSSEVTYKDWSKYHPYTIRGTQITAYDHALDIARKKSVWQIAFDMDEYPFSVIDTRPGFLIRFIMMEINVYPHIAEFSMQNSIFLGKRSNKGKYMIEQVLRRTKFIKNGLVKPMYKITCTIQCSIHRVVLNETCGYRYDVDPKVLRNNHYWNGRLQNWGNNTEKVNNMTVLDESAVSIAKKLKKMDAEKAFISRNL